MWGLFGKKTPAAPPPPSPTVSSSPTPQIIKGIVPLIPKDAKLDTTIRPICFGIDKHVTNTLAKGVGSKKFKRYEHVLYIMAQFSRLVYCDTGIMNKCILAGLGRTSDILNKIISTYDAKYSGERKLGQKSQITSAIKIKRLMKDFMVPPESYSLGGQGSGEKYATYISTSGGLTVLVSNTKAGKGRLLPESNPNSIFTPNDVILTFKGSSTLKDFKHDIYSQFTGRQLSELVKPLGIKVKEGDNTVSGGFTWPLIKGWTSLMKGLNDYVKGPDTRLFITGHSLGGAYACVFAFILAEAKESNSGDIELLKKIKSIHILSYGAPCVFFSGARNTFNRHLDSGLITFDRVVSQAIANRSGFNTPVNGNDIIPNLPVGFVHPGFRPLVTNFRPEANGRPYSMENIRGFYGASLKTRYRDIETWPFDVGEFGFDSWINKERALKVQLLTGLEEVEGTPVVAPDLPVVEEDPKAVAGGGWSPFSEEKSIYSKETQTHIPNLVSIRGHSSAFGFPHAEYLGMGFAGGLRLPGLINPVPHKYPKHAYFDLYANGVSLQYIEVPTAFEQMVEQVKDTLSAPVPPEGVSPTQLAALKKAEEASEEAEQENPTLPARVGGRRKTRKAKARKFTRRRVTVNKK
jgi:hypothetical protein